MRWNESGQCGGETEKGMITQWWWKQQGFISFWAHMSEWIYKMTQGGSLSMNNLSSDWVSSVWGDTLSIYIYSLWWMLNADSTALPTQQKGKSLLCKHTQTLSSAGFVMHCNLCWDNSSYPGLSSSFVSFVKWFVASDTNVWEWKDAKVKNKQNKQTVSLSSVWRLS